MKKILIITDAWKPQTNGVVTTLGNLINNLEQLDFKVKVISPQDFKTINCPGYNNIDISLNVWKVGSLIQDFNSDFIHIATEGPIGLTAKIYCDINNLSYSTSYHTNFPDYLNSFYNVPVSFTYSYIKFFHKKSVAIMVATKSIENDLKLRGFKNLKQWSRGVDLSLFDSTLRTRQVNEEKRLVCVSRVSKEKNLEAFFNLNINAKKIMIGDGPMLKDYKENYRDVEFKGFLFGKELKKEYSNADVFVFPSLTDTFGLVVIESFACGTPVAAFNAPGPRDIIENGLNGYFGENLEENVKKCFKLDRDKVLESSQKWTWEKSTQMFLTNILPINNNEEAA